MTTAEWNNLPQNRALSQQEIRQMKNAPTTYSVNKAAALAAGVSAHAFDQRYAQDLKIYEQQQVLSAGLAKQGNAEIQETQAKELARLGATGSGPTQGPTQSAERIRQQENKLAQAQKANQDLINSLGLTHITSQLTEKWENHKQVLDPRSKSDKDLAREIITKPPYYEIVSLIVRFFELGSLMDFYINSKIMTKTIEKRAFTIRRKNEKFVFRFMELLKKTEPVLWGETVMLIQTRLATKISPV